MPDIKTFTVRVFAGPNGLGSTHDVHWVEQSNISERNLATHPDNTHIQVYLSHGAGHDDTIEVQFWHRGHAIKRCGSGTVAAAWVLRELLNRPQHSIRTPAQDIAIASLSELNKDRKLAGYVGHYLPCIERDCDPNLIEALGIEPERCLYCGSDSDYLIAVFPHELQVKKMAPNHEIIQRFTNRAIITTAPSSSDTADFVLRYFAPQYGNPEDMATGSACCAVAPYWSRRLAKKTLTAQQLSTSGAEIFMNVNPDSLARSNPVIVWGACELLADSIHQDELAAQ